LAIGCAKKPLAPAPVPSVGVRFSADVAPVLERWCTRAHSCHGADPADSVDLDLRRQTAFTDLVGHPSRVRHGAARVQMGDPDASVLVAKLRGTLGPREGKQMPIDAQTGAPVVPNPLAPDWVDAVLVPWIRGGAPNN
jgi:hypothetical protein